MKTTINKKEQGFELGKSLLLLCLFYCLSIQPAFTQEDNPINISVTEGSEIKASIRNRSARLQVAGCPDISGSITTGEGEFSISLRLSETLKALEPAKDTKHRDDLCHYVGYNVGTMKVNTAGLNAGTNDAFTLTPTFSDLDVSIYRKIGNDNEAFPEIEVGWVDNHMGAMALPLKRWNIQFQVYSLGVVIETNDDHVATLSDSFLSIEMIGDGDLHLGGPVYLGGETNNLITYRWNPNAPSWTDGRWDVDGLAAVFLEIRQDGEKPLATMALEFNTSTYEVKGTLTLTSSANWQAAGFEVSLLRSSLQARVSLKDGTFALLGGAIDGEVKAAKPIEGALKVKLSWQQNSFVMAVQSDSDLKAFGVKCEDIALAINLNTETLSFNEISGGLSLSHKDFSDGKLTIQSVVIKNGQLTQFAGAGRVGFNGFRLNVTQVSYTPPNPDLVEQNPQNPPVAELLLAATMDLGWQSSRRPGGSSPTSGNSRSSRSASITIKNLKIIDGAITDFSIAGNVSATPMNVVFSADYIRESASFSGTFAGSFASTAEMSGAVTIGVIPPPDDYSYGYLYMAFDLGRGVPIGQSGLLLTGLRGAFGLNYDPKIGPQKGTYYLLGGLTVTDVAQFGSLTGEMYVVLGNTQRIGIKGIVQVTSRTPYFVGSVDANYTLGSGEVYGDITTTVKLPESGSVVSIDNNRISYRVGNNRFALNGDGLGGDLFTFIELRSGSINLTNRLDRPISDMSGTIRGSMSGSNRLVWAYPSEFTPWGDGNGNSCNALYRSGLEMDCDCTDDSSDSLGFGLAGGFNAGLSGTLAADLKNAGIDGKFAVEVRLNGSVGITTPISGYFSDCVFLESVSAYGRLNASNSGGSLDVSGKMLFTTSDDYSKSIDFSATF